MAPPGRPRRRRTAEARRGRPAPRPRLRRGDAHVPARREALRRGSGRRGGLILPAPAAAAPRGPAALAATARVGVPQPPRLRAALAVHARRRHARRVRLLPLLLGLVAPQHVNDITISKFWGAMDALCQQQADSIRVAALKWLSHD